MKEENFGEFIKYVRKKHKLTQQQLAEKYNVTYQAVSKWETGKNIPDMILIKQIAKDYNVSIEGMLEGKYKTKSIKNRFLLISCISILLISFIIFLIIFFTSKNQDFEFKTLSTECEYFKISGNISYNKNKSAIYITNIKYCGGQDSENYKSIECTLYESQGDIQKKISANIYKENKTISLEDYLKTVTLSVDNYNRECKQYTENSLYLEINATNSKEQVTTYKIPLSLENACSK